MPMFPTRRSRSMSVHRPTTPAATSPAMLAASQAFSSTPAGQKKMAQGAAAAALRTMSPTPTPVGQIQTRRMMERNSSVGASSNDQRGRARPNNMLRRNSSSSMTERTFREPSPARPVSSSGMSTPRQPQPPVPRLPVSYTNIPPVPKKSQRRSMSIDDMQMRRNNTAAQPQPRNSIRDLSNSRAVSNPALAAAAAAKKVTSGQTGPTLTRSDSNSSVNFSYPGRSRPLSPPPQKQFPDSPRQEAPPPRAARSPVLTNAISQTETLAIQRDLMQASQQPVKKRKKRDGPLSEGSHFQTGSTGAKSTVHPLEPGPPFQSDADDDYEPDRSRNRARVTGQASHFPASPTSPDNYQASDSDSAAEQQAKNRRALRASGALLKQPSVVREDWEGEQGDMGSSPVQSSPRIGSRRSRPQTTNMDRDTEVFTTPSSTGRSQRDLNTTPRNLAAPAARKPSLSPSRAARFSQRLSADMTQGQKHNPPPRSISPRKPALKYAAGAQGLSVNHARDSSVSASEGTDVSYDGTSKKAKKSAHVKFDNQPAVVGIAAEPDPQLVADSIQVVSPQYREQSRKWYAVTKKPQGRPGLSDDSDDEDVMAPRPQLPVFGSVRNRRNEPASSPVPAIVSPPSSSSSSSLSSGTTPTTMNTSVSSDHALGALMSRDQDQRRTANTSPRSQVLPAEVQQGKRIAGDSRARNIDRKSPSPVMTQQRADFVNPVRVNGAPPSIAVQPATPGIEEPKHNDQWLVDIPGGFPSAHPVTPKSAQSVQSATNHPATNIESVAQQHTHKDHTERADRMTRIQEHDSDHDSVYSDAAEEQSDGDGFGSIAAIVHSPVISPVPQSPEYESPTRAVPQRNIEQESNGRDDAWENAGARWKGLAESAKRTSLQPSAPIVERTTQRSTPRYAPAPEAGSLPSSTESSPSSPYQNMSYHAVTTESDYEEQRQSTLRKAKRATTPEITASNTLQNSKPSGPGNFASKTMRNSMRDSGVVAPRDDPPRTMRSSMRDSSANAAREDVSRDDAPRVMRSSMRDSSANVPKEDAPRAMRSSLRERDASAGARDDAPKSMRGSMRDSATASRDQSPKVPRSAVPARTSSGANTAALLAAKKPPGGRATLQKKTPPPASAAAPAPRKPLPIVRDDSDSESSFKKRRRARGNDTGRLGMRRSMREEASPPPVNVDRRTIRSLSPVQRRPFSPVNEQPAMRSTMRGSVGSTDAPTPTLRNQDTAQRSSSFLGRKNDARSPTRFTSLRIGSASRVTESEDDRSSRPRVFKSRFAGSDDEEGELRPVRGIPGKTKDDDSTDLEDSSDDEKPKKVSLFKKLSLTTQSPPAPIERPASPTSPEARKKRSFFGRLKKSKDEAADVNEDEETEHVVQGNDKKANGKQSANSAALGFSTDAEKEALIEETRRKLEAAKEPQVMPQAETVPRRMGPQRHKSDSWPLVPKISPDENERPYTADGDAPRPVLQRNSSSGTPSSPDGSSLGKSGKKKKFSLLRKAFGLKD